MFKLIDYAISHARLTIATLIFLLVAGFISYRAIPKESEPDVKIPIIYTQLTQRGISPEDSERLLLRPVETQFKSVSNVKEMRSTAFEGGGYVLLEFEAGFDSKAALADVRAKVDQAKRDLPRDADEPIVQDEEQHRHAECEGHVHPADRPHRRLGARRLSGTEVLPHECGGGVRHAPGGHQREHDDAHRDRRAGHGFRR